MDFTRDEWEQIRAALYFWAHVEAYSNTSPREHPRVLKDTNLAKTRRLSDTQIIALADRKYVAPDRIRLRDFARKHDLTPAAAQIELMVDGFEPLYRPQDVRVTELRMKRERG